MARSRTTAGKEPLLYLMVLALSLQLRGAVAYLAQDAATRPYRVDAVLLGIALHADGLLDTGLEHGGDLLSRAKSSDPSN